MMLYFEDWKSSDLRGLVYGLRNKKTPQGLHPARLFDPSTTRRISCRDFSDASIENQATS